MTGEILAGIEAGGTKFVCGVARAPTEILKTATIATRAPDETLAEVVAFFHGAAAEFGQVAALGVASFGPLDLDPASPTHGSLTTTPKAGWSGFNLKGALSAALGCPVGIDTDVTGSGLAEAAFGAGRGLDSLAYLTIGTGVGGALIAQGRPAHRLGHPEMGHVSVRRRADDAGFAGVCPFHGDCIEGLVSGPAVIARYGRKLSDLEPSSPAWAILADYIAQLCLSILLIAPPERIIIGGGVMSNGALYPLIRAEVLRHNHGYLGALSGPADVERLIVPPALGDQAGLVGAMLLAQAARP
jgi:fructokinase